MTGTTSEQAESDERFNELRLKELADGLSASEQAELTDILTTRLQMSDDFLDSILARLNTEQSILRQELLARQTESEALAQLILQQEQLTADANTWLAEFDRRNDQTQPIQVTATLIEQKALRLTLKHLGDGVTVKAVPHSSGWQVELYGLDRESPLSYLMYDADGDLVSNIDEAVEQIFASIIIDEPELGLHPYALAIVAELIQAAADTTQVIISTQSPALVDHFSAEDLIVVNREAGASTFKRLDSSELDLWLDEYTLGELWQKNVVMGGPVYE